MSEEKIPIIGSIRGARSLVRPVQVLCLAHHTFSGGLANNPKTQALLDMFCCQPSRMFDAERGGYVCDEHGGALRPGEGCDWEKIDARNPFKPEEQNLPETERALRAMARIELEMCAAFLSAYSNATVADFQAAKDKLWDELGETLTLQVWISTGYALIRSDN